MKTLNNLLKESNNLTHQIDLLNELSGYLECDDLSMMEIDYTDPDEIMLLNELRYIMEKLNDIKHDLNYLQLPVKVQGKLRLNDNGRYELKGYEFHCGDELEVMIYDDCIGRWEWLSTHMEHDGFDWFLVASPNTTIEGITARIR